MEIEEEDSIQTPEQSEEMQIEVRVEEAQE